MDSSLELTFPFVEQLPRREQSRWQKFKAAWDHAKAVTEEKGMLLPATFAAKLCDVSKQRIQQLMDKGTLERVDLNGHVFVTESSVIAWLNAPEDKGGRPRKAEVAPISTKQLWKISHEWAKETVGRSPKSSK